MSNYDLYDKLAPVLNNLQSINNQFDLQKKQLTTLTYTVDKLNLTNNHEKKNLDWLYSLQDREAKLTEQITLNEQSKSALKEQGNRVIFLEQQLNIQMEENNRLRSQLNSLSQRNEQLVQQSEIALKSAIREVNESFINRIASLEAQIQRRQEVDQDLTMKVTQLTHQLRVSEAAKNILQEECDSFEIVRQTLTKEKEMYLNEFRYLKENYFKSIDQLQNQVEKLKMENHSLISDNKSLQQSQQHYQQRYTELIEIHELASLTQGNSLVHLMKSFKINGVSIPPPEQHKEDSQIHQSYVHEVKTMPNKRIPEVDPWDKLFSDISQIN